MTDVSTNLKAIDVLGADAPDEILAIAQNNIDKASADGASLDQAKQKTLTEVSAAGYYRLKDGWRQIREDVRGKIAIEPAIRQPDGSYVVENVEIFYANAVKRRDGKLVVFTPELVERIVQRTNEYIASGGHEPSFLIGHPGNSESKAIGRAINLRIINGRPYCTITHLNAQAAREWADKSLMSVSAGFTADADALNCRIGHVAILGSNSPALSHLKRTDIFMDYESVKESQPDQYLLAYNAEEPLIFRSNNMSTKREAIEKFAAACASRDAGEPGHKDKMREAYAAMKTEFDDDAEFKALFASEKDGKEPEKKGKKKAAVVEDDEEGEELHARSQKYSATDLNFSNPYTKREGGRADGWVNIEIGEGEDGGTPTDAPSVKRAKSGGYNGSYVPKSATSFASIDEVAAIRADLAIRDFKDFMSEKRSEGFQFDSGDMLEIAKGSAALIPGIERAKRLIEKSPRAALGYSGQPLITTSTSGASTDQARAMLTTAMRPESVATAAAIKDTARGFATAGEYKDPNGGTCVFSGDTAHDLQEIQDVTGLYFSAEAKEKAADIFAAVDMLR